VFRGAVGIDGDGEDGWRGLGVGGGMDAGDEREDERESAERMRGLMGGMRE
jgi:hypothetical protein